MEKIAACKFCGQIIADCDVSQAKTEEEALEMGTMQCNCGNAMIYQRKRQQAESAKEEICALFGEDDELHNIKKCEPEIIEFLKKSVDLIADGKIYKLSCGISGGGTADIKCDSKGKVTVQRAFTIKAKREVE